METTRETSVNGDRAESKSDSRSVGPSIAPIRAPQTWKGIFRSRLLPFVTTPLIVLILVAGWKFYVEVGNVSPYVLPPPESVGSALATMLASEHLWSFHIWTTFYETVIGFALAVVSGCILGFFIGRFRLVEVVAGPFIVATQVIPKVALVPLFIVWFGFGPSSKIAVAATLALFPIVSNVAFGVQSVQGPMHELMDVLRASRWQRARKLDIPHTLPYLLTGAEVAIVLATIGAIVGEYLAGDRGLGRLAITLQNGLQIPELYAAIVIMTVFGFVLYALVRATRKVLIPWHQSGGVLPDQQT